MKDLDMRKLETAITYVQRMADGMNPVNNRTVDEDNVLNDPNVIRCMYFIKEILEEIQRNNGNIKFKNNDENKMEFPVESVKNFRYESDKTISRLVEQFNEPVDEYMYKKLTYKPITKWLKLNGYLKEEIDYVSGKKTTLATAKGNDIGIRCEKTSNSRGIEYYRITYCETAQMFIAENMDKILDGEMEKSESGDLNIQF